MPAGFEAGYLAEEDLKRLRKTKALMHACETRAPGITVEECVSSYEDYAALIGEFVNNYEVDETEDWQISVYTGRIYYV